MQIQDDLDDVWYSTSGRIVQLTLLDCGLGSGCHRQAGCLFGSWDYKCLGCTACFRSTAKSAKLRMRPACSDMCSDLCRLLHCYQRICELRLRSNQQAVLRAAAIGKTVAGPGYWPQAIQPLTLEAGCWHSTNALLLHVYRGSKTSNDSSDVSCVTLQISSL